MSIPLHIEFPADFPSALQRAKDLERLAKYVEGPLPPSPPIPTPIPSGALRDVVLPRRFMDLKAFGKRVSQALCKSYAGHCVGIAVNGQLRYVWARGMARKPSLRWTVDTPMHVASLSKFPTAIGMNRCLDIAGIGINALIHPYLPRNWTLHEHTKTITFDQLMRHEACLAVKAEGFNGNKSSYAGLKWLAAHEPGPPDYSNEAYAMCRVLMATVAGGLPVDADLSDEQWDACTIALYLKLMQQHVFGPAGVGWASMVSNDGCAAAYCQPYAPEADGVCDDYGDMRAVGGGAGWHISVRDYLRVVGAFYGYRLLSPVLTRQMIEREHGIRPKTWYGYDSQTVRQLPIVLSQHGGTWSGSARGVRTYFFVLPTGEQVVIYVNNAQPEHSDGDLQEFPDLWYSADRALDESLQATPVLDSFDPVCFISGASGKALDVAAASSVPGAALTQYDADGRDNQRFDLTPIAGGAYGVIAVHSGLALESVASSGDERAAMVQYPFTGRRSQAFRFVIQGDGSQLAHLTYHWDNEDRDRVLGVSGASLENGASVIQFGPTDGGTQRWWVAGPMLSAQGGLAIDAAGGLEASGGRLIAFGRHGEANQLFIVERLPDGLVRIRSLDGRVFDVAGASQADGAQVILYAWHDSANQKFRFERDAEGLVRITASHSGKPLGFQTAEAGADLVQQSQGGSARWRLHHLHYAG